MRWASLAPETTLWVITAGGARALVGRSHRCMEPPIVQKLPICTRPNAHREGWEASIGPYAPDYGALSTLRVDGVIFPLEHVPPDLSEKELLDFFQKAMGYAALLLPVRAADWSAYESLVKTVATAFKSERPLQRWFDAQRRRLEKLISLAQRLTHKPTVAFLQPTRPVSVIGGWSTQLAAWSGGDITFSGGRLSWESLLHIDPEVIVLSVPGSTLQEAGEALARWTRLPQVQGLSAFRQKRLYAVKGIAGLFHPSPLLIAAAEGLYELLHTPTHRYNQQLGRIWAPFL